MKRLALLAVLLLAGCGSFGAPKPHTLSLAYKAGDTFYEPSGCVHRVTRNPSARAKTRLLAVILHPRDTEKVTVPEEAAKND